MASDAELSTRVRHLQRKMAALHNLLKREKDMLKKEREFTGAMARTAAQHFLTEDRPSAMSYEKWKASLLVEASTSTFDKVSSSSNILQVGSRGDVVPIQLEPQPLSDSENGCSSRFMTLPVKRFQCQQPPKDVDTNIARRPFFRRTQQPAQQSPDKLPKVCVRWQTHRCGSDDIDAEDFNDTEVLFMKDGGKKLIHAHKQNNTENRQVFGKTMNYAAPLPVPIWTNHKFGKAAETTWDLQFPISF